MATKSQPATDDTLKVWCKGFIIDVENNVVVFPDGTKVPADVVGQLIYMLNLPMEMYTLKLLVNAGKDHLLAKYDYLPKEFVDGKLRALESVEPEHLKMIMNGGK